MKDFPLPRILSTNIGEIDFTKMEVIIDTILSLTEGDNYLNNPQKLTKVKALEREIDRMVYQLYGLSEEEIKIVESSS